MFFGVSLQGVPGFLRHSHQTSLGVCEILVLWESIAEEWMVSLKTLQFFSGSSERSSIASNRYITKTWKINLYFPFYAVGFFFHVILSFPEVTIIWKHIRKVPPTPTFRALFFFHLMSTFLTHTYDLSHYYFDN